MLFTRAARTTNVWGRFWGLLGQNTIATDTALCLTKTTQVHTFGMRMPIECAGCDANGRVLWVMALSPWRVSPRHSECVCVWEAGAGTLCTRVQVGDILLWEEIR
jgi:uncharacterized membrane protein (UPF0127 family)